MSTDFDQLIAGIEQEARDEGPQAVRELEQLREEFGLASARIGIAASPGSREAAGALGNNLGNKLRKTQPHPEAEIPANMGSINPATPHPSGWGPGGRSSNPVSPIQRISCKSATFCAGAGKLTDRSCTICVLFMAGGSRRS